MLRLAEPVEVAIYYGVSEALANALKHAHATEARVVSTPRTAPSGSLSPMTGSAEPISLVPASSASRIASKRSAAGSV